MAQRKLMWIIDRFEGDWAVIEPDGGVTFDIPRRLLPNGSREGDVLWVEGERRQDEATWRLERDVEETGRRRERAQRQLEQLKKRDPGGDIRL